MDSILPDIHLDRFKPIPPSKIGERLRALFGSRAVTHVPALVNTCAECQFSDTRSYRRLKNRTTMTWEPKTRMTCSVDDSEHPVQTRPDAMCIQFQAKTS